jgi:hypothetical protein
MFSPAVAAEQLHARRPGGGLEVSWHAPQPVAFYAGVFFLVNATYVGLIWELVGRTPVEVAPAVGRIMRVRSLTTLGLFGMAALVALRYARLGLAICIGCLIVYLKPDPPTVPERPRRA